MALTVRSALATDASAIDSLAKQFAEYLRALGDRTEFRLTAEAYLRDGFGLRPAFKGLVAEEHGCVIGYLLYHFGYDSDSAIRTLDIVDLFVDSTTRRRGAGTALMTEAAQIARSAGARQMVWCVYHANDLAIAFYERLGAHRITDLFFMKLPADSL